MNLAIDKFPRLYAIVDEGCFAGESDVFRAVINHALELVAGGATLLQYRSKSGRAREMLGRARELKRVIGHSATLIINDRADLCLAAGFGGVHVGQDDITVEAARLVVGPKLVVGFSTHNPKQVREADSMPVDYIAVGPVFATASKANPDPVIGLDGVRAARALTKKPLVAIGGITRANFRSVIEAGADSVAIIGDLLKEPRRAAVEFLSILA